MKIIWIFTQIIISSSFWCQTYENEYSNGEIASCIFCLQDIHCPDGRNCWANTWCKSNVLCSIQATDECTPLLPSPSPEDNYLMLPLPPPLSPQPPPLSPPPPPLSPTPPPPPLPSPRLTDINEDPTLKYFKEIGLPIILAMIGLFGSILSRNAIRRRHKSKRKKTNQIQLASIQSVLDDGSSDENSEIQSSNKSIETEKI